jgi:hypothetical protein
MSTSDRPAHLLGFSLLLTALVVNQWSLAWQFSGDEHIETTLKLARIWSFQVVLGLAGMAITLGWRPFRIGTVSGRGLSLLLVPLWAFGGFGTLKAWGFLQTDAEKLQTSQISHMTASESVHLNLSGKRLKQLSTALRNLEIRSVLTSSLLADQIRVRDIASGPSLYRELPTVDTTILKWKVAAEERSVAREDFTFLTPFLETIGWLEEGSKFYFIGGNFSDESMRRWEVEAGFTASGRTKNGERIKAKGRLVIGWVLASDKNPEVVEEFTNWDAWAIDRLAWSTFKTYLAPETFFTEELASAVPDKEALEEARRNRAQEMIVRFLKLEAAGNTWDPPHEFFGHMASWRHPAISVVDWDRDGWDDFYSMARYGRNLFFHNQGDGTFQEIGRSIGLDVVDHSDMALFADFDNDGDDDLFLGRTLAESMFFTNEGDSYIDRSQGLIEGGLPYFATTAAATDFNLDGMLDFYVGTYAAQLIEKDIRNKHAQGMKPNGRVLEEYLPERYSRELLSHFQQMQKHKVRDRIGPPNILVQNDGNGGFSCVENTPLEIYRNTFQASFADFDVDGDPDVYVANDFAPNHMFRNDGGTFVDITAETNAEDVGFGMGISWGDYDRDGDQDAYVSNMYSKAGNRILKSIKGLNQTFLRMAAGNSLLELENGSFERVSSLEGPGMHVEMAGWSWGSQFVDVDNDGWLDLYALSGHYTAPREIRAGHDL